MLHQDLTHLDSTVIFAVLNNDQVYKFTIQNMGSRTKRNGLRNQSHRHASGSHEIPPSPLSTAVPPTLSKSFNDGDNHAWMCLNHFWPDFADDDNRGRHREPRGKREERIFVYNCGSLFLAIEYLFETVKQHCTTDIEEGSSRDEWGVLAHQLETQFDWVNGSDFRIIDLS